MNLVHRHRNSTEEILPGLKFALGFYTILDIVLCDYYRIGRANYLKYEAANG